MSDTINIGGIQVSKFYLGGSSDVKIYLGTTKLYPHLQEPCFAVVDNISVYTARTYVDVYETSSDKWYKLNNLNAYEKYGVYGSGRTITYYEGKLTIDDGYEYQYSGGSWVNVGEVSGSTATLPDIDFSINYNAANYISTAYTIPQTEGQLQNVDAVCNYGYKIVDHSADGYISVTGNSRMILSGNNGTYLNRSNTQANCPMTIVSKAKTTSGYSIFTDRNSSSRQYMYRQDKTYAYLCGTGNTSLDSCICSDTVPSILSVRVYYDSGIKAKWNNWTTSASSTPEVYAYNNQSLTNGGALFCDYSNNNREFWQGDFYWIYMSQNTLTDEQVQQVIAYNESGGGQTEYPVYYDEIQDPPDNVSFSSMTEAEEYECPYVGMKATINGDKYIFSGDSQSGYEWVEYSGTIWLDPSATNALFSIGHYWGENYKIVFTTYLSGSYSGDFGSFWIGNGHTPIELSFYNNGFYYDMHNPTSTTAPNVRTTDYDYRILSQNVFSSYENSQKIKITLTYGSFKAELADSGTLIYSRGSTKTGYSWYDGLYQVSISLNNANAKCHLSHIQIYNGNNELVNDFKFIKNNGVVGSQEISIYDSVTNTTYNNTNSNTPVYHIET